MGVVAAARHMELGTRVAIKVLRADALDAEEALERFAREAKAASRLRGEHVARVFDVGKGPDGMPYMVMEYLEGQDLDALLGHAHSLDVGVAVGYVLQACEAVAEAHSVGIVHRDLKPRNLFLTRRVDGAPLVKVLDFGIAKRVSAESAGAALTGTLAIVGSPPYMSPEQMRASRDIDERSDIWSLGVCLYELTTGVLPFDGETALDICAAALKNDPRRPDELRTGDLPRALGDVVMRCLRKEPAARFPDVGALAEALEPFAPPSERGAATRIRRVLQTPSDPWIPPEGHPVSEPAAADTRTAASLDSRGGGKARSWIAPLSMALGALGLATTATLWMGGRAAPSPTPPGVPSIASASYPEVRSVAVTSTGAPSDPTTSPAELRLAPMELRSPRHARAGRPAPAESAPAAASSPAAAAVMLPTGPPMASLPPSPPAASSPPPPPSYAIESARVRIGSAVSTVGTTASSVNRAFAGLGERMTACYRQALPHMSGPLEGAGTMHVETDDEGVIVDATLGGPLAGAVGACIAAAVRGRQVPNVDTGRVRADVPLTFVAR